MTAPSPTKHKPKPAGTPGKGISPSGVRSRAQLNRRQSFTSRKVSSKSSRFAPTSSEQPLLGGLTFLDIVFIGVAYSVNLLKTLGLAELADIAWHALRYTFTALPFAFYQRWSRSQSPAPREDSAVLSSSEDDILDEKKKQRPSPIEQSPAQLSPFHHLVILLTRFACSHFPHLLPRVLFAEETMLPFVGWRTGGASWGLMREMVGEEWKAVWLGDDAYMSEEARREEVGARKTTTLFYLHGGGFSLGSVSFYAEALLRVLNKIAFIEGPDTARARCIAVEYDLSPSARFPQPLLQCLRCYAHLVEVEKMDPRYITFAGDSAGGNLAMSMLLVLSGQAKDQTALAERDWSQLPMPGKALLISPWCDLRPKQAHAFASLRDDVKEQRKSGAKREDKKRRDAQQSATLADSMVSYDWDYVASETLLHFAQVYAGVLPEPRRVAGPLGWLSHLCGVLGQGVEAERSKPSSRSTRGRKRKRGMRVMDPARRLATAVNELLERPLFERLKAAVPDSTALSQSSHADAALATPVPSFSAGLQPLFTPRDRTTRKVLSTAQLHDPPSTPSSLDSNILLSPILGDWTQVHLAGGALVTWGERERLSADIESWVEQVHSGMTPDELRAGYVEDDQPRQDGHKELELRERKERGKWLKAVVEHGPGGVHAWPFVSMYLAGTEEERERGLETLARFVAAEKRVEHEEREEEEEEEGYFDQGGAFGSGMSSPTFTSGDARIAAAGRRFTDEEYQEALGLGVTLGGSRPALSLSTTPTTPSSASRTPTRTPMSVTPPTTTPGSPSEYARASPRSRRIESGEPARGRRLGDSRPLWWTTTQAAPPAEQGSSEVSISTAEVDEEDEEDGDEDDELEEEAEEEERIPPAPLHPSDFGLSYAPLRRDAEGLSDIAEEASVLSASPSLSPQRGGQEEEQGGDDDDDDDADSLFSPQTRHYIRLEAERQLARESAAEHGTQDNSRGSRDAWWA
ncbi:alpha/beta-hydrolase [Jaminaea rosea]|uniref:Alpha/beta-hydrolase n=1 Tax=Jaminaea rosea TaxID=1569628 RepID=A0A316UVD3_9BASI|nr:alpha/beta-hydrolase [Jaminaea rosea]PWN29239.1 alpha/beta-hydrolase [Jaminaea rosea]